MQQTDFVPYSLMMAMLKIILVQKIYRLRSSHPGNTTKTLKKRLGGNTNASRAPQSISDLDTK